MTKLVVFTDLDGTLLDHRTYSMAEARPAIKRLKETGTPLVMVSSKTRTEIEIIRHELDIHDPFVPENGGAIFMPDECGLETHRKVTRLHGYQAIVLGEPAEKIGKKFDQLAEKVKVRALSRMDVDKIVAETGLTVAQAQMARQREFGEAFIMDDPDVTEHQLAAIIAELGLRMTRGGRFYNQLGANDKGRAAMILIEMYKKKWPDLVTAAIGDAPNDEPLLGAVDWAYLVARPDRTHSRVYLPRLTKVSLPGPAGFNQSILSLLDNTAVT